MMRPWTAMVGRGSMGRTLLLPGLVCLLSVMSCVHSEMVWEMQEPLKALPDSVSDSVAPAGGASGVSNNQNNQNNNKDKENQSAPQPSGVATPPQAAAPTASNNDGGNNNKENHQAEAPPQKASHIPSPPTSENAKESLRAEPAPTGSSEKASTDAKSNESEKDKAANGNSNANANTNTAAPNAGAGQSATAPAAPALANTNAPPPPPMPVVAPNPNNAVSDRELWRDYLVAVDDYNKAYPAAAVAPESPIAAPAVDVARVTEDLAKLKSDASTVRATEEKFLNDAEDVDRDVSQALGLRGNPGTAHKRTEKIFVRGSAYDIPVGVQTGGYGSPINTAFDRMIPSNPSPLGGPQRYHDPPIFSSSNSDQGPGPSPSYNGGGFYGSSSEGRNEPYPFGQPSATTTTTSVTTNNVAEPVVWPPPHNAPAPPCGPGVCQTPTTNFLPGNSNGGGSMPPLASRAGSGVPTQNWFTGTNTGERGDTMSSTPSSGSSYGASSSPSSSSFSSPSSTSFPSSSGGANQIRGTAFDRQIESRSFGKPGATSFEIPVESRMVP